MKTNKVLYVFLIFLLSYNVLLSINHASDTFRRYDADLVFSSNEIKNVILFIGDGMGEEHIGAASVYAGRPLSFSNLAYSGYVSTASLSGVTDSAAAASALSTGIKVKNGNIARYNGADLSSILEIASVYDKKTGVVTTDLLCGATPAGFSAHADDRGNTTDIINSQMTSQVDLFIGKGQTEYTEFVAPMIQNGYDYVTEETNLSTESNKIFATLSSIEPIETATEISSDLGDLVQFSLSFLENENGFVLVVEGANIDKKSHINDINRMIYELLAFDRAVDIALDFASDRTDTFVCVTADHETGGFVLGQTDTVQNMLSSSTWSTTGHTATPVPYYAKGYCISDDYIDNTDIFDICHFLITKNA